MHRPDAYLANAYHDKDKGVVFGMIFGDHAKDRFEDGAFIRTSSVKSVEDHIVTTLNTTYRVINWRGDE